MDPDDVPTQQFSALPDEAPTQPGIRIPRPPRAGGRWRHRGLIAVIALLWIGAIGALVTAGLYIWRPHPTLAQVGTMPPRPPGWPATLQLGMSNGADGAAAIRQTAPF